MGISTNDGMLLVKAARKIVSKYLRDGAILQDHNLESRFSAKSGVFVTLNDSSGLRGCIGYPLPDRKLFDTLRDAAIAAATEDPRFSPLKPEELDAVTFEVTVLTLPEKIHVKNPKEYLKEISIGRDGLIVRDGSRSGLLLPQVPTEYGWNAKEFLEHACEKAGLPKCCWMEHGIEIQKFQGIIFREEFPGGSIIS